MDSPEDGEIFVLEVPKKHAQAVQRALKDRGLANTEYKVSKPPEGKPLTGDDLPGNETAVMWVPVSSGLKKDVEEQVRTLGFPFVLKRVSKVLLNRLHGTAVQGDSGIDKIRAELKNDFGWSELDVQDLPDKWLKYGDILVLFTERKWVPSKNPQTLLEVFRRTDKKLRCIILHTGRIEGELREPTMELLTPGESSVTIHVENGFKYKFDVLKIMFAPGNGTERMRFGRIKLQKPETIVDMFAGLGYFTIPLASYNKSMIQNYVAIEKNPNSFFYLKQNISLNGLDGLIEAINGDNRLVGEGLIGKCDRILMGYLPTTKDFLPRAFQLAKKSGCIIHYHYISKKLEAEQQLQLEFKEAFENSGCHPGKIEILFISRVKNYAPQLIHYCTDLRISWES